MSSQSLVIGVGIVSNVLSVVGIVICNKYITEVDGYNFMVFLSFLHFFFTMIGCRVMLMMNIFSYSPAPFSGVLPVAIGSLLSVAFMNLNLSNNSVGFSQVINLILFFQLYLFYFILHYRLTAFEVGLHSMHSRYPIFGLQHFRVKKRSDDSDSNNIWSRLRHCL